MTKHPQPLDRDDGASTPRSSEPETATKIGFGNEAGIVGARLTENDLTSCLLLSALILLTASNFRRVTVPQLNLEHTVCYYRVRRGGENTVCALALALAARGIGRLPKWDRYIGNLRRGDFLKNERIAVVEAMRGIAAIGVALCHFSGWFEAGLPLVFRSYGWLGGDIFFVISGFVVPLSLYGRDYQLRDFPRFMMRRFMRLEPPYLASIGLCLIVFHAASMFRGTDPGYSFPQVMGHLFYAIPLTSYSWLIPVYWTLAYEFIFYILVGLTFAFLAKREIEFTICTAAIIAAGCFYLEGKIDVRVLEFVLGVTLMPFYVAQEQVLRIGAWLAIGIGTRVLFRRSGHWSGSIDDGSTHPAFSSCPIGYVGIRHWRDFLFVLPHPFSDR
jgi:hypothetical protein